MYPSVVAAAAEGDNALQQTTVALQMVDFASQVRAHHCHASHQLVVMRHEE